MKARAFRISAAIPRTPLYLLDRAVTTRHKLSRPLLQWLQRTGWIYWIPWTRFLNDVASGDQGVKKHVWSPDTLSGRVRRGGRRASLVTRNDMATRTAPSVDPHRWWLRATIGRDSPSILFSAESLTGCGYA